VKNKDFLVKNLVSWRRPQEERGKEDWKWAKKERRSNKTRRKREKCVQGEALTAKRKGAGEQENSKLQVLYNQVGGENYKEERVGWDRRKITHGKKGSKKGTTSISARKRGNAPPVTRITSRE